MDTAALAAPYRAHVATLLAGYRQILIEHQLDAIVVASGQGASKSQFDDQHWPTVVTPHFAHWLPLPAADAFLIITGDRTPRLVRVVAGDYWDSAPHAESEHWIDHFDQVEVASLAAVGPVLPTGRVAVIGERMPDGLGTMTNPPAVIAALDALRTIKTPYEIACLSEASARAVRGHRHLEDLFARLEVSELTCHLAYLAASGQGEADTPYQGIVARGRNAAVLHYIHYAKRVPGHGLPAPLTTDSLLVDAGARYLGYCSDITRTWVRGSGDNATLFAGLVAGVDRLQRQLCDEIKVGMAYEALHDRAHELLAELLVELEIGRGAPSALVERGVTRALFPHGLGHSLGIQVHDVGMKLTAPRPDNRFLRNTSVITEGQVFTIEPGCYVIDALIDPLREDDRKPLLDWHAIEAIRPFGGVRIEDDVVVRASGVHNLTRTAWAAA